MRRRLKQHRQGRSLFRATFERYSTRRTRGGKKETVLVSRVHDAKGRLVTEHLWFRSAKPFIRLKLQPGDRIEFTAAVEPYTHGSGEPDYQLSLPTTIRKCSEDKRA